MVKKLFAFLVRLQENLEGSVETLAKPIRAENQLFEDAQFS
jgi:hypothetical protein